MKTIKYVIVIALVCTQWILPFAVLCEYLLQPSSFPFSTMFLFLLSIIAMMTIKDSSGQTLFTSNRAKRIGLISFFPFSIIKYLE